MKNLFSRFALFFFSFFLLFLVFPHAFVFAGVPDVANSTLVATSPGSDSAPADGVTTTSMTLTFQDNGAVPLAGDTVSLSIPSDPTAVISPASTTLDGSGQAVFTITSTTVGTVSIDATDSTGGTTTLAALGQVTFTAVPTGIPSNGSGSSATNPSCSAELPIEAPNLYSITTSGSTATLYFVQPHGQFTGYTISYGLNASADSYNVTFDQGSSPTAVSYTVKNLAPNTTYYFKVRANNGCATGAFSATRASNNTQPLPITGSVNPFIMTIFAGAAVFLVGIVFLLI